MGLCKVEKGHTYSLREFNEAQFAQLSEVAGRLMEFRDLVKEVVRSACRTALLEAGFTPDDYFYDGAESPGILTIYKLMDSFFWFDKIFFEWSIVFIIYP